MDLASFDALFDHRNDTRRTRPYAQAADGRVPLKAAGRLERKESKGGLRSIFTRSKAEKPSSGPGGSESEVSIVSEVSTQSTTTPDSIPTTPAARLTSHSSRLNLRSKSIKTKTPTAPRTAPRPSTKSETQLPPRTTATWDPPPLFQAYPQAIKHAQLSASTLSADAIIRISNHKRSSSLRDEGEAGHGSSEDPKQRAAGKKLEKAKSKHRRQVSGSISKADWTQKIFVLVTSGYLLQYAGEGPFDRLPEKMMQLGKDSVAFASDLIPGRHWVLQISQAMDPEGNPAADSRSLLSRLTSRSADYRRTTTSLLLVLESAEEMDSWLAVVRREIEALGGKKQVSESGKPKTDEKVVQSPMQPSHRYLVTRDSSNPTSPISPTWGSLPKSPGLGAFIDTQEAVPVSPGLHPPLSARPHTGYQSVSNSVLSHDGRQLEDLRDRDLNRLSYISSGQHTNITVDYSSGASTPTRESTSTIDEQLPKTLHDDALPKPVVLTMSERRRTIQGLQSPLMEPQSRPFRHSTFGGPSWSPQNQPVVQNFSVPTNSEKRFSSVPNPLAETFLAWPNPETPSRGMLRGTRKAPPVALNMSRTNKPITPPTSPPQSPPVYTPTESSFRKLQQIKATTIDIPPRPRTSAATTPVEEGPPRRSSLMPLDSPETAHIKFDFPRRFSSRPTSAGGPNPPARAPTRPQPMLATFRESAVLEASVPQYREELDHLSDSGAELENEVPEIPARARTRPSIRPASLQVRPLTLTPQSAKIAAPAPKQAFTPSVSSREMRYSTATPRSAPSQRVIIQSTPKPLGNRKSIPVLMNGPPPAPPPNCALPPLPQRRGVGKSPMVLRNSMRV